MKILTGFRTLALLESIARILTKRHPPMAGKWHPSLVVSYLADRSL